MSEFSLYCSDKDHGKKILGEERSHLAYTIFGMYKFIINRSQGKAQAGQEPGGGNSSRDMKECAYCLTVPGLLSLYSYTTCDHLPMSSTTHSWQGPTKAIINQDSLTPTGPTDGEIYLIEVPSFQITVSCIKLIKTT